MRIANSLEGTSALQRACRDGDENRVKHLLEGVTDEHILRRDKSYETALHDAIRNGKFIVYKFLMKKKLPSLVLSSNPINESEYNFPIAIKFRR